MRRLRKATLMDFIRGEHNPLIAGLYQRSRSRFEDHCCRSLGNLCLRVRMRSRLALALDLSLQDLGMVLWPGVFGTF